MSQVGYTPILIYASGTPGNTPSAANLTSNASGAELAINYADGKLFYKDSGGTVQILAVKMPGGILPIANGGTNSTATPTAGAVAYGTGTAYAFTAAGSSGQVLTSAGAGTPTWTSLSSIGVTTFSAGTTGFTPNSATSGAITLAGTLATTNGGTGLTSFTANGVVYASSTSALTTGSALTFDGTNLVTTGYFKFGADGNLLREFAANKVQLIPSSGGVAGGYLTFDATSGYVMIDGTSGAIPFGVSGTEQMRLTSTGLGIGTTSPAYKLEIYDATNPRLSLNTGASGNSELRFSTPSSGYQGLITYSAASNFMAFYTSATERMRLDSSGNLGLGVTPSAWGSAYKAIQASATNAFWGNSGDLYLSNNYLYDGTGDKYIVNGSATAYQQINGNHQWKTAASGTAGAALSFTQAMTLDASGNLGIGTTSPVGRLHVKGGNGADLTVDNDGSQYTEVALRNNGTLKVNWYWDNSGSACYLGTDVSAPLILKTNATERMRIDSSGNLLVGATSGSGRLFVSDANRVFDSFGNLNVYSSDAVAVDKGGSIGFGGPNATGGTSPYVYAKIQGIKEGATNTWNGALLFGTTAGSSAVTERMRIDSLGNLLVGTTSNPGGSYGGEAFVVYRDGNAALFSCPSGANAGTCVNTARVSDGLHNVFFQSGTAVGNISTNGSSTAYNTTSDYRLKDNQAPLTGSGAFIDALQPKTWTWKADGSKGVGFIAHEVQAVSPGSVVGEKDAVDEEGKPKYQAMEYGSAEFIANIIAELQSLRARVAALESKP